MFKLEFDIAKSKRQINIKDKIFSIGSCFSDNIGSHLDQYKFQVLANPFGTIFNPYSIFKLLRGQLDSNDIIKNQEVFYHWDAHSDLSSLDQGELNNELTNAVEQTQLFLKEAKWLVITFGTSFIYTNKKSNQIVGNCHKVPQKEFIKSMMSVDQIAADYAASLNVIRKQNPDLHVILTVSPVRHIKDGLHENNISKGVLHQAVSKIIKADNKVTYFPSYEIMIDELRDYRFYKKDRIHPSEEAIAYIWTKFVQTLMDEETSTFIDQWNKILNSLTHKSFHPQSNKHQQFLIKLISEIENFENLVDVNIELEQVRNQINLSQ